MAINIKENGKISYHSDDVTLTHEAGKVKLEGGHIMTDSSSNIKIGGTSGTPADTLDIAGRIVFTSQQSAPVGVAANQGYIYMDTSGDLRFVSDTFTGGKLTDAANLADADDDTKIHVQKSADEDKIRFDTGGTERMIIDDAGNVGIGTSSPQKSLHIRPQAGQGDLASVDGPTVAIFQRNNNSSDANITILAADNAASSICFADVNDEDVGRIRYNHSDNSMSFRTGAGNNRIFIDSSGKVGVGTATPDGSHQMDVNGAVKATGFTGNLTGNASTATTAGTVTAAAQTAITSVGTLSSLTVAGDLTVDTDTLKVDSSGNYVGIGNASPQANLDLQSASNANAAIHVTSFSTDGINAVPYLYFRKSDNNTVGTKSETDDGDYLGQVLFGGVDSSSNYQVGAAIDAVQDGAAGSARVPAKLLFRTGTDSAGAAERMAITKDGLVGIGTSNPTKLLHISSASRDTPHVLLESTEHDALNNGSVVQFMKTKTGAVNDVLGRIQFFGKDGSGNTEEQFASIYSQIENATHGSETALMAFRVANAGTVETPFLIKSGKVVVGPAINAVSKTPNATLDIEDDAATTTNVVSISADALTDGKALFIESTSNSANTRVLGRISNTNALAINATPLSINQDAVITASNNPGIPLMDFEAGANDSVMALKYKEIETANMTGTSTDVTGFIPQYAIPIALGVKVSVNLVDGVTAREITKIGSVNDDDSFMATTGGSSVTLSTTSDSVVLPYVPASAESQQDGGAIFNQATADLRITHANLTAGKVKVCLWYYKITPPT